MVQPRRAPALAASSSPCSNCFLQRVSICPSALPPKARQGQCWVTGIRTGRDSLRGSRAEEETFLTGSCRGIRSRPGLGLASWSTSEGTLRALVPRRAHTSLGSLFFCTLSWAVLTIWDTFWPLCPEQNAGSHPSALPGPPDTPGPWLSLGSAQSTQTHLPLLCFSEGWISSGSPPLPGSLPGPSTLP